MTSASLASWLAVIAGLISIVAVPYKIYAFLRLKPLEVKLVGAESKSVVKVADQPYISIRSKEMRARRISSLVTLSAGNKGVLDTGLSFELLAIEDQPGHLKALISVCEGSVSHQ